MRGFNRVGIVRSGMTAFLVLFFLSLSCFGENETSFVSLVPGGGTTWNNIRETIFTVSSGSNRLLTIASAGEERQLVQMDKITGGYLHRSPSRGEPEWSPVEIGAWPGGDRLVVGWGKSAGSERFYPVALEYFSIATGNHVEMKTGLPVMRFEIDQEKGILWGIGHAESDARYSLFRVDLSDGGWVSSPVGPVTGEAILRSVMWDAGEEMLYGFFQRTLSVKQPDLTDSGGFLEAYEIQSGNFPIRPPRSRVWIPDGKFRKGGLALDRKRKKIHLIPFEPGGTLYRVDVAGMVLEASFSEKEIDHNFSTGGALCVHQLSGDLFLANGNETHLASRIIRVRMNRSTPEVIRRWTSGADPSFLEYDPSVNRLYGASQPSQSLTIIDPEIDGQSLQSPMAYEPRDFQLDPIDRKLWLLTGNGEVFLFDADQGRLVDKIESFGLNPASGLVFHPMARRVYAGTFGQAPPVILDSGTLQPVGFLDRPASALAISPMDGVLFLMDSFFSPDGGLNLLDARTGRMLNEEPIRVPDLFNQTTNMSVDRVRKILYGITLQGNVWSYDWVNGNAGLLEVPENWRLLSRIAVDSSSGMVYVSGRKDGEIEGLMGFSPDDRPGPGFDMDLEELDFSSDLKVSSELSAVFLSGTNANGESVLLYSRMDPMAFQSKVLTMYQGALESKLTVDPEIPAIWVAGDRPSSVFRMNWPIDDQGKVVRNRQPDPDIENLTIETLPGRVDLEWETWHTSDPTFYGAIRIYRKDGELAAFRPLTPGPIPVTALTFTDVEVIPGSQYRYRVEFSDSFGKTVLEGDSDVVPSRSIGTVIARPMQQLIRVGQGLSESIFISVDGLFHSGSKANATIVQESLIFKAGGAIELKNDVLFPPGVFELKLEAGEQTPAGTFSGQAMVSYPGQPTQPVWFFAQVVPDSGGQGVETIPYQSRPADVKIFTDSFLREEGGNLLVVKGRLGAGYENTAGTHVTLIYQIDDEPPVEVGDVLANNSEFAFSIRLPDEMDRETMLRCRATWAGSANALGGVSPLLRLPVGAYSAIPDDDDNHDDGKPRLMRQEPTSSPEVAVFVLGATPTGLDPVPDDETILGLLEMAENSVLKDFHSTERKHLSSIAEIETALTQAADAKMLLVYALADTESPGGTIKLPNQERLSPGDLAGIMPSGETDRLNVIVIEGPRSGVFAETGLSYPEGTTVLTSSGTRLNEQYRLVPTDRSFSGRLFPRLALGASIQQAFDAAEAQFFLDPYFPQFQYPQKIMGEAWQESIGGRFISGLIPDLGSPEILKVSPVEIEKATEAIFLSVAVRDDLTPVEDIEVQVERYSLRGRLLDSQNLPADATGEYTHSGILSEAGIPGCFLEITARDAVGNVSSPVRMWVSAFDPLFDVDGSGTVDAADLLEWLRLEQNDRYTRWLFDFGAAWFDHSP